MQIKNTLILITLLFSLGCKGFYAPITTNIEVPDGPPEYKAGWHDGCSTGLSTGVFVNGRFNKMTMGNGMYQHDPIYQAGWGSGWFSCTIQPGDFVAHPMFPAPFE